MTKITQHNRPVGDITEAFTDVAAPVNVDVSWREDSTVLWVNVDGTCILRICQIPLLVVQGKNVDCP